MDDRVLARIKDAQKKNWARFAPMETFTAVAAPRLVSFGGVKAGDRVLDVAAGTGVVAVTAARRGAKASAVDITPELVARARENAAIAEVELDAREGDAEALPWDDGSFDVVLSQFGHMFAPRPDAAVRELLRVLRPGGTLAFSTWPPEVFTGRIFALVARYLPKPPAPIPPPTAWGSPEVVRERLEGVVEGLHFDRAVMRSPFISPPHARLEFERDLGGCSAIVAMLADDPARLATFRRELDALVADYFEEEENVLRQDYLLVRANKPA